MNNNMQLDESLRVDLDDLSSTDLVDLYCVNIVKGMVKTLPQMRSSDRLNGIIVDHLKVVFSRFDLGKEIPLFQDAVVQVPLIKQTLRQKGVNIVLYICLPFGEWKIDAEMNATRKCVIKKLNEQLPAKFK